MKIFQIVDGKCYWDATSIHRTVEDTKGKYPEDVVFVEAHNKVFEGWGFNKEAKDDDRFVKPVPLEGFVYDDNTGTIYSIKIVYGRQIAALKLQLSDTDYKVIKCMECQLAGEALPYDVKELYANRQSLRAQINDLETKLIPETPVVPPS